MRRGELVSTSLHALLERCKCCLTQATVRGLAGGARGENLRWRKRKEREQGFRQTKSKAPAAGTIALFSRAGWPAGAALGLAPVHTSREKRSNLPSSSDISIPHPFPSERRSIKTCLSLRPPHNLLSVAHPYPALSHHPSLSPPIAQANFRNVRQSTCPRG